MPKFKYRATNSSGRPTKGVITANSEIDLYNQLQAAHLELISCSKIDTDQGLLKYLNMGARVKIRDLIQLFMHMEQMQSAGVPLLDALGDIRDTTDNPGLRDIMAEIHRDVSEGTSLSESMSRHPKVFGNLYTSLIASGEETGDLTSSYLQLVKYLKWVDQMQGKVRKATRYPIIVCIVVIATIMIMMGVVVPQIVGFLENMDQELGFATTSLIATSEFVQENMLWMAVTPVILLVLLFVARKSSDEIAYRLDLLKLSMPILGPIIRKINIARFAQTFGALYASGIDVLQALAAARKTVGNLAIVEAVEGVEERVKSGSPISEAFNVSGEFPSLVVRMIKVGEESGSLTPVLDQVGEFYTQDVDESIDGMISMIEPSLTGVLGVMILWIAAGVFGPIYAMLGDLTI